MFTHYKIALEEMSRKLRERNAGDIEDIYAFGSRVRGDNDERSDFDILIVVKGKTPEKEMRIIGDLVDFEFERDLSFIPVLKDTTAFAKEKKFNSPFYQNIMNEGIRL